MSEPLPYTELFIDPLSKVKYRCVLPQPKAPKRILILLHGVGSNETHIRHLAQGQDSDTLVILTQGPIQLGPSQHAWFRVKFTPEGPSIDEPETVRARTLLSSFVQSIQSQFKVGAEHTLIAGFSQGGIMSASLALVEPELVKGFAILSGRILPEITPHIAPRHALAHLSAFIAHGEFDQTLVPLWAEKSKACLSEHHVSFLKKSYPIAHEVSPAMKEDFTSWSVACFSGMN